MTKVFLLRHGKVTGKAALYGRTDVAVANETNDAIVQALATGNYGFDHIYSSPLQRCYPLAERIALQSSCQLTKVDGLQEMDFGDYDGVAFDHLHQNKKAWQQLEAFWQQPSENPLPNAETLSAFYQRVTAAWQEIIDAANQAANQRILLVCHGGVIRMILAYLFDMDITARDWYGSIKIPNASLTELEFVQGCLSPSSTKCLLEQGAL